MASYYMLVRATEPSRLQKKVNIESKMSVQKVGTFASHSETRQTEKMKGQFQQFILISGRLQ